MEKWQLLLIAHTFFGFVGMVVWYHVGKMQGRKLERRSPGNSLMRI
jgi:membrane protein DedA with SNARE-associated domain